MSSRIPQKKIGFIDRITKSVPLLVTVVFPTLLIFVASTWVITEQIIGKKKDFTAAPPAESTTAQKQVEHRLQVARRAGGSPSATSMSSQRIYSTSASAVALPAMTEMSSVGSSSFGGGFGGGGTGMGTGTGIGSGSGLGGKGFMNMSFLGMTVSGAKSNKVALVVDISASMMEAEKEGFASFQIIRNQMTDLILRLSPLSEFGAVVVDIKNIGGVDGKIGYFSKELLPANVENKTRFSKWVEPINTDKELKKIAFDSVSGVVAYEPSTSRNPNLKKNYRPVNWVNGIEAALALKPDLIFVITGNLKDGRVTDIRNELEQETNRKRIEREKEELIKELKKEGIDVDNVFEMQTRAMNKAKADLAEINKKQVAKGKNPFVVADPTSLVLDKKLLSDIKKAGYNFSVDTEGWRRKNGSVIWRIGENEKRNDKSGTFKEMEDHLFELRKSSGNMPVINFFYFHGEAENEKILKKLKDDYSKLMGRLGGKVQFLKASALRDLEKTQNAGG